MSSLGKDLSSGTTEEGFSLLRTGEEVAVLRHRLEQPARLGRYGLGVLGTITAGAGAGLWFATASLLGIALGVFGAVLIVLGVVQHLLLRRDRAHWPDDAFLWKEGLELVLHNGEVRGFSWSDPKLALDLVARRAPPPAAREYLLVWMMDPKIPSIELSADRFERLKAAAVAQHLIVTEHRSGKKAEGTQWVEIRPTVSRPPVADWESAGAPPPA